MDELTVFDKVEAIDSNLEFMRDVMLGLDESMGPYILNGKGDIDKVKVYKLTDTFMLYIMNGNPLYNKNELMFYRYAFLSMFMLAGSRECYDDDHIIFKIILSFVDTMLCDMRVYAEMAATNYSSLSPTFVELDNASINDDGTIVLNEGEDKVKFKDLPSNKKEQAKKDWETEHPNSLIAEEFLKINEKLLDYCAYRPNDFADAIEYALYAFLNDEGKGYYDDDFFVKITEMLVENMEKR